MKSKSTRRKTPSPATPLPTPGEEASSQSPAWKWFSRVLPPALIVLAGLLVYGNSFKGEFVLDDDVAIERNPTIRKLWPLRDVLFPSKDLLLLEGNTVQGRPLLNLSFALNHAAGGLDVRGYHAVNLAVHLLAGLLLYGIVRQTLRLPKWSASGLCAVTGQTTDEGDRAGTSRSDRTQACADHSASCLAMAVALVWVVHPLQTESVSYLSQRAESMGGMFFLLTMYLAVKGFVRSNPGLWRAGAVTACVMGAGVKEIIVAAPILVLLYDWIFVAGSWRELWRTRSSFYAVLFVMGWGAVGAGLVITAGSNLANLKALALQMGGDKDAVWHGHEVHWLDYARTQWWAVARYLRLCFWPAPLVFAYGNDVFQRFSEVAGSAVIVVLLLAATGAALWRRHWTGYAGAWCFLILAPTSSIIPLSGQTIAEHRMYLPLAGVVSLVIIGGSLLLDRLLARMSPDEVIRRRRLAIAGTALLLLMLFGLGTMTLARNEDYRTPLSIWRDTASKWPSNPSAQNNYSVFLYKSGDTEGALRRGEEALRLKPDYPEALNNTGLSLMEAGRLEEAAARFERVDQRHSLYANAQNSAGVAYFQLGRTEQAMAHFEKALQAMPLHAEAHNNMGLALEKKGQLEDAIAHCKKAAEINPKFAGAEGNLGNFYYRTGRYDEATRHFTRALELDPRFSNARNNLGNIFLEQNRVADAIFQYEKALEINAADAEAHNNLGVALYRGGRVTEAIAHYRRALEIRPDYLDARGNLAVDLLAVGNAAEAVTHLRMLAKANPPSLAYLSTLAWVLATSSDDAVRHGGDAVELAERVMQVAGDRDAGVLRIVAAAYAETGRFEEAEEKSGRALGLAIAQGNDNLAESLRREHACYRSRTAFRERAARK